jgi:hypothetical protein
MRVLSIDVGIKNLGVCLFENDLIKTWEIVNLTSEVESNVCNSLTKNKKVCGKCAKYEKNEKYFCATHAKNQDFLICPKELKEKSLKKAKVADMQTLLKKYFISFETGIKKEKMLELLNNFRKTKCLDDYKETKENASKLDLIKIGKALKTKFDELFDKEDKFDYVIIENQISPIANRMKTIQGMVAQYFIMKEKTEKIEFISASNKLKNFEENKENYKDRKKLGIVKCVECLNKNEENKKLIPFLEKHKKKDDLADCFLQGIWFFNKNKN